MANAILAALSFPTKGVPHVPHSADTITILKHAGYTGAHSPFGRIIP